MIAGLIAACAALLALVLALGVRLWRSRQALRRAELLFRGVFQQQFQFMALLSAEGRILDFSDSLVAPAVPDAPKTVPEQVIGLPMEDSPWWRAVPQTRADWPAHLKAAREGQQNVLFETAYQEPTGEMRLAHVALIAVRENAGQVAYFILHATDITDARRAEAELRQAHAALAEKASLLSTTLNSISQGILMMDAQMRIGTFNQRACELLDLSPDYLRTRPLLHDIVQLQLQRGDFGPEAVWMDEQAREQALHGTLSASPDRYMRSTSQGRVLEVLTQRLPDGGLVRTFADVTEFVAAQNALQRSTLLLQATQNMAGVGGWEIDLLRDETYWTEGVYRILGVDPQRFVPTAHNTRQFFTPEGHDALQQALLDAERTGEAQDVELEMLTADQRRIWVHCRSMLALVDGKVVKQTSVIRDISAQKRADAALRASEEQLRLVTSQMPGVVYRLHITPDGRRQFQYISPGVRELYGITAEQVMADGSVLSRLRHPADRQQLAQRIKTAVDQGQSVALEYRILTPQGETKWVQMNSNVVEQDEHGQVRNGVMVDITASKQAELALRERDELWKLALESTGDGVWDWYLDSGVEILSRRCMEMYGYSEGELPPVARSLDSLTHPDDLAQMMADREAHFAGETPIYSNEHRIRCKDGSWKWVLSRGMVISRDEQGRPLRMTGTHTDITQRKLAETLIWQQANFDALTGLPNRRMLHDRLAQELKKSRRDNHRLALLFIDLDRFKEVNDTMGHAHGDDLLVQAARRISHCMRETDTVARMGGDEFTVILPGMDDLSRLEQIVQQILTSLSESFDLGTEQAYVSASIGITLYPDDGADIDSLLRQADQALYVAKDAGRNRFSYFTPSLQDAAQARVRLTNELRRALPEGQLWVAYQPIVELATGAVYKAEALLRWQHPSLGLVSPGTFIPIAEASGLIVDIGNWVFRQAIASATSWRSSHDMRFQVSVNKSPVQFHSRHDNYREWFDDLEHHGLPGQAVVVEITEGLLLDASTEVNEQLLALRDAGIAVALDDFGTGYSSLAYLQNYDIDFLKIDQSFVRNLSPQSRDLALCKAIIVMAHALGMKVVAEGVETAEQRTLLQDAGCDFGQGYLFARPMPAEAFGDFLQQAAQTQAMA